MALPLSTDDWILTRLVVAGVVDPELVAISLRHIVMISPCGQDPGWTDVEVFRGTAIEELTIATPFSDLIPTS